MLRDGDISMYVCMMRTRSAMRKPLSMGKGAAHCFYLKSRGLGLLTFAEGKQGQDRDVKKPEIIGLGLLTFVEGKQGQNWAT